MKKVVILIISHKEKLSNYEMASIQQCYLILGQHPIRIIVPKGMPVDEYLNLEKNLHFDFINPKWLSNYKNFNKLKIHPFIYNRYKAFEYILFYEPDAYVFSDELEFWCNKGYSYIGAPWIKIDENINLFDGVGNGGFSLRRVHDHLKALSYFRYRTSPKTLFKNYFMKPRSLKSYLRHVLLFLKKITIENNTYHLLNDYTGHEDYFWSKIIAPKHEWFKVPKEDEALKFSFEVAPSFLLEKNSGILPFGCHAWYREDNDYRGNLEFWSKFIKTHNKAI